MPLSPEMERLKASVTKNTGLVSSIVQANKGYAAEVRACAGDKAASIALADEMDASALVMAEAEVASTPVAGTPAAEPPAP